MGEQRLIEQEVLALPGFSNLKPPKSFARFFEEIAPNLGFSELIREAQGTFKNSDARIQCLQECLQEYPADAEHFLKFVQSKKREVTKLEQAIRIYGTQPTTDLVVAIEMSYLLSGAFKWDAAHRPEVSVDQTLRYARKASEAIGESPYAHLAYAAGLVFDTLALIGGNTLRDRKKKFLEFNDGVFRNGLVTARIGLEISKNISHVEMIDYVFAACLVHDIGKSVAALLDEQYLRFYEFAAGTDWPRSLRMEAESLKFGITHNVYGSLMASYFEAINPAKTAVLFHHDPYLLDRIETKNDHVLGLIVSLASNVSHHCKVPKEKDDLALTAWFRPETKKFPVSQDELLKQISKIVS